MAGLAGLGPPQFVTLATEIGMQPFQVPPMTNVIWFNQHICTTDDVPAGMMYLP